MKKLIGNAQILIRSKIFEDVVGFVFLVGIIICLFGFPNFV